MPSLLAGAAPRFFIIQRKARYKAARRIKAPAAAPMPIPAFGPGLKPPESLGNGLLLVLILDCSCDVGVAELADKTLDVADEDDGVIEVSVDAESEEAEEEEDAEADDRVANATVCASRDCGEGASKV